MKYGALSILGFHPYPASHLFGNRLADGQSQSRSLYKRVQLLEAFEYFRQVLFFNTHTRIFYVEFQTAILTDISHLDISALSELDGIGFSQMNCTSGLFTFAFI